MMNMRVICEFVGTSLWRVRNNDGALNIFAVRMIPHNHITKSKKGGVPMRLSLVIPCYNEENNVVAFFHETERTFANANFDYEYVFVNDGSVDGTQNNLVRLFEENANANIKVINFSRNFGKEAAIYSGLENSEGELTCIIDADLQQHPQVVLQMMSILENEPDTDCVCAFQRERHEGAAVGFLKKSFYAVIDRVCDIDFVQNASDFRLFKANVKSAVLAVGEYHRFSKGIFAWVGFNTKYIPYDVLQRHDGESKWSVKKLFRYAFGGIISFTDFPLKLATYFGTLSVAAALVYAIVEIILLAIGKISVSMSALAVILLLLIGGIQLICTGVLGIYLGRTFAQVKNRPVCIVKSILKKEEKK